MNASSQRALIWIGIVLAVIYSFALVALLGFIPAPSPSLGVAEVVQLYARHNLQFRFGVALMIISGAFALPWGVVITAQMAREEKGFPIWAALQLVATTLGVWLFAFPPVLWGVAAFTVTRDPALTMLMHELAWLAFVTPVSFFAFQLIPVAVICLRKTNDKYSAFPRWLGYLTISLAIVGELGFAAMLFKSGPFAWNGLFTFYLPLVFYGAWETAIIITLLRAIGHQERTQT
jgi:hypothetical protein